MRILITNDDGINAPGFAALERIAKQLSDDLWMVAPAEEQSGAGHSLTLTRPKADTLDAALLVFADSLRAPAPSATPGAKSSRARR